MQGPGCGPDLPSLAWPAAVGFICPARGTPSRAVSGGLCEVESVKWGREPWGHPYERGKIEPSSLWASDLGPTSSPFLICAVMSHSSGI
jgi:hypothetical protein